VRSGELTCAASLRCWTGDWIWASLLGLAAIAPLGTFLAVVVAYISYLQKVRADRRALGQKTEADNRNAWWSRVQDEQDEGLAAISSVEDNESNEGGDTGDGYETRR
jgi:hypothetical protein